MVVMRLDVGVYRNQRFSYIIKTLIEGDLKALHNLLFGARPIFQSFYNSVLIGRERLIL
jgi:hypothetical protein